ncbi:aldehyde dehydrogenase [Paraflavitalea sp. CAU 1676]|uniref:aldehyde dehydrogenase n=1 Tax=Paraflavitalea sp. CAU 1676 TaxID=3032598 RepID=UPI0023DAF4C2|nr:aldehyde dehydrogenase [Paraflavitalea sp. CAU 1676]MDF2190768.1 aldehyde dehydrogenase [Paraflavitalea sp. CAU 1676]
MSNFKGPITMSNERLTEALFRMRHYFESGVTGSYKFRKEQLLHLKRALLKYEQALHDALLADLRKSPEESWVTETGFLLSEINATLKDLRRWMEPQQVPTNLVNLPSTSYVQREALGVVLIIGPWNYPLQLLLTPLVGAIAAGNCTVLKASEFAPATSAVMKAMIEETYPKEYILYTEGEGASVVPALMQHFRFDHVFYTGSTTTGKLIYKMAAEQLSPVTLELGGKSPCVVENDANIKVAARRIALAKFSNAGQMCVAPDYVLVHRSIYEPFIQALRETTVEFFTNDPINSYNYGRIINAKQFRRLLSLMNSGRIIQGGDYNEAELFLAPTVLADVAHDSLVMQEEIFGPILPVIPFTNRDEARAIINLHPNPLAFYVFAGNSAVQKAWVALVPSGGACINNCSWHLTNHHLPFGGRGASGTGAYHGRSSFEIFSHRKAVMKTPTWFDPNVKYPPFKGRLKLFKWIIR